MRRELLVAMAGALIVIAIAMLATSWAPATDVSEAGSRGDFFGGHLAGFGALASTLLFFVAILLQRDELRETRLLVEKGQDEQRREAELREIMQVMELRSALMRHYVELRSLANVPGSGSAPEQLKIVKEQVTVASD